MARVRNVEGGGAKPLKAEQRLLYGRDGNDARRVHKEAVQYVQQDEMRQLRRQAG